MLSKFTTSRGSGPAVATVGRSPAESATGHPIDHITSRSPSAVIKHVFRQLRATALLLLVVVSTTLLALLATSTPAMAATALMVGGTSTPILPDFLMRPALNGMFDGVDPLSQTDWQRVNVYWPAQSAPIGFLPLSTSVEMGTDDLYAAILNTPGPKTVVGMSAGSLVVDEVMARLANDPAAPSKDEVKFVVIAANTQFLEPTDDSFENLFRSFSGYTFKPAPDTPYDLTVISAEYDGYTDFPDRWWNLTASANALAGMLVSHNAVFFADVSSVADEDIRVTTNVHGGVTTTYFVRAEQLPLVTLLPFLSPMEPSLKEMVDAGYSRNDATTGSTPGLDVLSESLAALARLSNSQAVQPDSATPLSSPTSDSETMDGEAAPETPETVAKVLTKVEKSVPSMEAPAEALNSTTEPEDIGEATTTTLAEEAENYSEPADKLTGEHAETDGNDETEIRHDVADRLTDDDATTGTAETNKDVADRLTDDDAKTGATEKRKEVADRLAGDGAKTDTADKSNDVGKSSKTKKARAS